MCISSPAPHRTAIKQPFHYACTGRGNKKLQQLRIIIILYDFFLHKVGHLANLLVLFSFNNASVYVYVYLQARK